MAYPDPDRPERRHRSHERIVRDQAYQRARYSRQPQQPVSARVVTHDSAMARSGDPFDDRRMGEGQGAYFDRKHREFQAHMDRATNPDSPPVGSSLYESPDYRAQWANRLSEGAMRKADADFENRFPSQSGRSQATTLPGPGNADAAAARTQTNVEAAAQDGHAAKTDVRPPAGVKFEPPQFVREGQMGERGKEFASTLDADHSHIPSGYSVIRNARGEDVLIAPDGTKTPYNRTDDDRIRDLSDEIGTAQRDQKQRYKDPREMDEFSSLGESFVTKEINKLKDDRDFLRDTTPEKRESDLKQTEARIAEINSRLRRISRSDPAYSDLNKEMIQLLEHVQLLRG